MLWFFREVKVHVVGVIGWWKTFRQSLWPTKQCPCCSCCVWWMWTFLASWFRRKIFAWSRKNSLWPHLF